MSEGFTALDPGTPISPPQNLEAEQSVLGAVLLSDTALPYAVDSGLKPGHFYRDSHGLVYRAMCELHAEGRPVDPLVIAEYLKVRGKLDEAGGQAGIDMLASSVPAVGHFKEYVRIVRECAMWRRRLRATYKQLAAVVYRDEINYQRAREYGR